MSDFLKNINLKGDKVIWGVIISLSLSLRVELTSSPLVELKDRVAEGERSALAIITSFSDCS